MRAEKLSKLSTEDLERYFRKMLPFPSSLCRATLPTTIIAKRLEINGTIRHASFPPNITKKVKKKSEVFIKPGIVSVDIELVNAKIGIGSLYAKYPTIIIDREIKIGKD